MLPTAITTSITFFALNAFGKTPAMLNFTAGAAQIASACKIASATNVLTSKRFVSVGKLDNIIAELQSQNINIIYLEDLAKQITLFDKLLGSLAAFVPAILNKRIPGDAPAVILFTSGSEGTPKGVVLSHRNIQSNRFQLSARIDFGATDKVFNCLPMFHSFGLTGGTLLPILSGIKTFYYPSPLHYKVVPELIYDTNSTILFGTDTFLAGYAKFASSYDFYSIRYIFAGAEKLKEQTRRIYEEKYGVRIFEGYGATETSPVISTGTPMQNRIGSVGRFMPGIEYRLEQVPGIEAGGQLFVKGGNIMLGYLRAENIGKLEAPVDGWYDTGDIVEIDPQGYIFIKGRVKRFSKIGGEMVSLAAVEIAINKLWQGSAHAVVAVPDAKKGEQIVLLSEYASANREEIITYFKSEKLAEIALPKRIIIGKI
ncbi:MAG: AMP-binding protein, partial [Pseudomonadota bacterium]